MFVLIACALSHVCSALFFMSDGLNKKLMIIPITIGFTAYSVLDCILLFLISESRFTILRGPLFAFQVLTRMILSILFDIFIIDVDGLVQGKRMAAFLYTLLIISVITTVVVFNLHFKEWIVTKIIKFSVIDTQTFDPYP